MALEAKDFSVKFGSIGQEEGHNDYLFKDISFTLEKKEILTLRGPSGCGKTTLLKCIAELLPYDSGSAKLYGKSAKEIGITIWRTRVMYVPQRPALHTGTPRDFYEDVLKFKSQKHRKLTLDPIQIAAEWGCRSDLFYSPWTQLSGGEAQRVALAIALALEPEVLLLDEPTSSLDPETVQLVENTIKGKYTAVWITHDPAQEKRVATKTLRLGNELSSNGSAAQSVRLDLGQN